MFAKYTLRALPALLLAGSLSSCSLFDNFSKKEKAEQTKHVELPSDRESIAVPKERSNYTPDEIRKGIVKGDWAIETVYGKKVVGEEPPFIKFVPEENRIYGNNGCNVINAGYSYNPNDSTISFDHLAVTMRLCHKEGLTDYEINTALGATKYYSWNVKENDYYLSFYNEDHQEVMVLMHQNFEFLNGTWRVSRINDQPVSVSGMKMVIDVDEGKVHGNAGCNVFNGKLDIDMERPNSISFSAIAMTMMYCPDKQSETEFVVALEEVSAARPVSNSEVVLYDDQSKPVLTLVRSTDRD